MENRVIQISADSLEAARAQVKWHIALGLEVKNEKVISDGRPRSVFHVAESAEKALERARKRVPAGVQVIEERSCEKQTQTYSVEASAEEQVFGELVPRLRRGGEIGATRLVTASRRGFLGIGKRRAVFEAEVFYPAHAEISWQTQAKIEVTIGNKPRYELLVGSGVCDVCNRTLIPGKAFKVPVRTFYKSPAYRRHCEQLARTMGVGVDTFIANLRAADKTTHSAVCDSCIHLF
jgi:hypothetical protein